MRGFLGMAMLLIAAMPAMALDGLKVVGDSWFVGRQADRFGSIDVVFAARKAGQWMFALKCAGKEFQIIFSPLNKRVIKRGAVFDVKFRADREAIVETKSAAIEDGSLYILPMLPMLLQIAMAKEIAFRFKDETETFDVIVPLKGADKALSQVTTACR